MMVVTKLKRQLGIASVIVLIIVAVVITLLSISLNIANTGINDTLNQSDNVAALFLAESGLENAMQRLTNSTSTCDATLISTQNFGKGSFDIAAGLTTDFDGVTALAANQCRIQITGNTTAAIVGTERVIQAVVDMGGGGGGSGIAYDANSSASSNNTNSLTWSHTVSAGTNRLLVVGASFRNNSGQTISAVTYNGTAFTQIGFQNNGSSIRVELWQGVAPTTGANNIIVTLTGNARIAGGAVSFTGVDQTTPIEANNFTSGNGTTPSVTVATATANAWVIDVQGEQHNPFIVPAVGAGQTQRWNLIGGGSCFFCFNRARGSGSTEGPVVTPGNVTMSWAWFLFSRPWAIGAAVVRPAGGGSTSASILSWREIVQ